IGIAVIEARVEAEFILYIFALVLAARDADCPRALDPRDLAHGGADGSRSGCDDDGFARLRLAYLEQPHIRRHTGPAEHADCGRDRRKLGVDLDQPLAVG